MCSVLSITRCYAANVTLFVVLVLFVIEHVSIENDIIYIIFPRDAFESLEATQKIFLDHVDPDPSNPDQTVSLHLINAYHAYFNLILNLDVKLRYVVYVNSINLTQYKMYLYNTRVLRWKKGPSKNWIVYKSFFPRRDILARNFSSE